MADPTLLNVPSPQTPKTLNPLAGTPATNEVVAPAQTVPDLLRDRGITQAPQIPSTPEGDPAAQTLGGALSSPVQSAPPPFLAPIGPAPTPASSITQIAPAPPVIAGLQPGVAGGVPTPIAVPATPGIISSASPVAVGAPTLATTGPAQGTAAPRIAGVQMVAPTPPAVQTASTLTQPTNAPQVLQGISTMMQQP